jgi:hypothetical protein
LAGGKLDFYIVVTLAATLVFVVVVFVFVVVVVVVVVANLPRRSRLDRRSLFSLCWKAFSHRR